MRRRSAAVLIVMLAIAGCQNRDQADLAASEPTLDALYQPYEPLQGDLHLHSSTASFDSTDCGPGCQTFTAAEQLAAAREAGLDFAALTEHDRNPNQPGSGMSDTQWNAALEAVAQANTPQFVALAGYEWTRSQRSCFEPDPQEPDYAHKIVILPPAARGRCDSDVCLTPDELGKFVHNAGGIILTPHPWRILIRDNEDKGLPPFVTRNYFDYEGDGAGGVFVGAEVGPDFPPLSWKALCTQPGEAIDSQTVTLAEWQQALLEGKHLAAVAASDRHFGFTPFRSRTTVVFATAKTPEAILEALRARRTMAANLEPFAVRLAMGSAIVGETARDEAQGRLRVGASSGEVERMEVWSGDQVVASFPAEAVNRDLTFAIEGKGPIWAKITGTETDPATGTPRTTITSPIWRDDARQPINPR
jgi:hypothetical protein